MMHFKYLPYVEPKAKRGIKYTIDTNKYLEFAKTYLKKRSENKLIAASESKN